MQLDVSHIAKDQTYIVAVSGGVDSVVLLHLIANEFPRASNKIIVAHFDHSIRSDSAEDAKLVEQLASGMGYCFELGHGKLKKNASEAAARSARYTFLHEVKERYRARGIITAHHQDDLLETVLLNMTRGSGRRGYTSLRSSETLVRPLLKTTKAEIVDYARRYKLTWREDSTNRMQKYRRNYFRQNIMPKLSLANREELLELIEKQLKINNAIDVIFDEHVQVDTLSRYFLVQFSYRERCEVLAAWLRAHQLTGFDRLLIEHLAVAAVAAKPGKYIDVYAGTKLAIGSRSVTLHSI